MPRSPERAATGPSRKGQIPLTEVVLVLVVFFIIVSAAGVVYVHSLQTGAAAQATAATYNDLADTTKAITDLPELRYGLANRQDVTMLDTERAQAFVATLGSTDPTLSDFLRERFAGYRATIRCLYPANECTDDSAEGMAQVDGLTLFDYTDKTAKNTLMNTLPVVLYNPLTKGQAYGLLIVTQVT